MHTLPTPTPQDLMDAASAAGRIRDRAEQLLGYHARQAMLLSLPLQTHTPICPWCGRPVAACPDPAGHDRADRASETTWLRQARGGSGAR